LAGAEQATAQALAAVPQALEQEARAKSQGAAEASKINAQASAALGSQQALQQRMEQEQRRMQAIQDYGDRIQEEMRKMQADGKLFHDRSLGNRLLTAIGIMVGGGPIVAAVNQYIDKDVDKMRADYSEKQNLYKLNVQRLGDAQQAYNMTRLNLLQKVEYDLKAAGEKSMSKQALAGFQKNVADIRQQQLKLMKEIEKQQALKELRTKSNQGADKESMTRAMLRLEMADPEMAAKMRPLETPVGLAASPEAAKEVKESIATNDSAMRSIGELEKMGFGSRFSIKDRARAKALTTTLTGALRVALTGPGTMSDSDRAIIQDVVADPTAIFSWGPSTKAKLATLKKVLSDAEADKLRSQGLQPRSKNSFTPRGK
jgi:hypothetical protein